MKRVSTFSCFPTLLASSLSLTACVSSSLNFGGAESQLDTARVDAHPILEPISCTEDDPVTSPPPVPTLPSHFSTKPVSQTLTVRMGTEKLSNPYAPNQSTFWGVLHRSKDAQYLFVPAQKTEESKKILDCYQNTYADARSTQLVPIHRPKTFVHLLSQSGPGPSVGFKGNRYDQYYTLNGFYTGTSGTLWKTLPIERIITAWFDVPTQTAEEQPHDYKWSCGPNSGARAILLWGCSLGESYDAFRSRCPKSFGKPQTNCGKMASRVTSIFTLGLSHLLVNNLPDVGPDPSVLANYLTSRLPYGKSAKRCQYSSFLDCARDIKKDIDYKNPVIAFFVYKWNAMHYANVIGMRLDSYGMPTHFMILETWRQCGELSYNKMKYWMDTSGSVMKGPYNLIRFFNN